MIPGQQKIPALGLKAFTLLELSIVLVIISLVTGMAVSSGISIVATARQTATQQKMRSIDDALMAYRVANDRLPCPADLTLSTTNTNFGLEAATPGTCTGGTPTANFTATGVTNTSAKSAEGAIPALTLGLPADFMVDGWGNRIRYAVDVNFTSYGSFTGSPLSCANSPITINDSNGNARSTAALYALISHGANGHGAYTKNGAIVNANSSNANELINCHCNSSGATTTSSGAQTSNPATYVQMQPSADSTSSYNSFDDIVSFKERWQLQTAWDKTGNCSFVVYISDGQDNQIQEFTPTGNSIKTFSINGPSGSFAAGGMVTDASGNFWVGDNTHQCFHKFSSNWTWLATLGSPVNGSCTNCLCTTPPCTTYSGSGNGQFNGPGMFIDASGNLWVSDYSNYRVQEFTSSGVYIGQFGNNTVFPDGDECVILDKNNHIWVNDDGNYGASQPVQEFSISSIQTAPNAGNLIQALPQADFSDPSNCAMDSSGNLWFTNGCYNNNNPIQKWSPAGTLIQNYGTGGTSGLGVFGCATGPAIDPSGNLWFYDFRNGGVQIMTPSGTFSTTSALSAYGPWGGLGGIAFGASR